MEDLMFMQHYRLYYERFQFGFNVRHQRPMKEKDKWWGFGSHDHDVKMSQKKRAVSHLMCSPGLYLTWRMIPQCLITLPDSSAGNILCFIFRLLHDTLVQEITWAPLWDQVEMLLQVWQQMTHTHALWALNHVMPHDSIQFSHSYFCYFDHIHHRIIIHIHHSGP